MHISIDPPPWRSKYCLMQGRFPFFTNARVNIRSAVDMDFLIGQVEASFVIHNWLANDDLDESCYEEDEYSHRLAEYPVELHGADLPEHMDGDAARVQMREYFCTRHYFRHVRPRTRVGPRVWFYCSYCF